MEFNNTTQSDVALENISITVKEEGGGGGELVSDEGLQIALIINHVVLSGSVCIMGIVTNIINLIIFYMQGLNSTMNISFFAMAVADLCSLITIEWANICLNPFIDKAELPFEPSEVQYLSGGWPHACFGRITCWITAYMAAERCLCIAVPLKVKQIITPGRTRAVICIIYLLMFATLSLEYVTLYFGEKFYPERNETRVGLVVHEENMAVLEGKTFILFAVMGFLAFFAVVIFTVILVIKLQEKSKWRQQCMSDKGQTDTLSTRDKKTMKMVVLIASILIVCMAPSNMLSVTVFIEPEFSLTGRYSNVFNLSFSIAFLCEAINSSINLFLYYNMSSKYRSTFHQLFARCSKGDTKDSDNEKSTAASVKGAASSITSLSTAVSSESKDELNSTGDM